MELLSAMGSQAVDPNCKQLRENPDQEAGNYRWIKPPSNERETLNVTRINLSYSCETLLLCLTRVDLLSPDPTDLSLRNQLTIGVKVIKDILYQVNWTNPTIRFADVQINAFEEVETENKDIFRKASENTFDHTELSVSVSLSSRACFTFYMLSNKHS